MRIFHRSRVFSFSPNLSQMIYNFCELNTRKYFLCIYIIWLIKYFSCNLGHFFEDEKIIRLSLSRWGCLCFSLELKFYDPHIMNYCTKLILISNKCIVRSEWEILFVIIISYKHVHCMGNWGCMVIMNGFLSRTSLPSHWFAEEGSIFNSLCSAFSSYTVHALKAPWECHAWGETGT